MEQEATLGEFERLGKKCRQLDGIVSERGMETKTYSKHFLLVVSKHPSYRNN